MVDRVLSPSMGRDPHRPAMASEVGLAVLLYGSTVGDAHDRAGTMLDDVFFYGGWAGGLLTAPGISDEQ